MFTGGLKECEMTRVKLQGVCPTAMARLMYFMYTGQIRVTEISVFTAISSYHVPSMEMDNCRKRCMLSINLTD